MVGVIKVMLVDDHVLVRKGFQLLLQDAPDIQVIGEAGSGEEACEAYPRLMPDVLVMDITMPGMGGIEAVSRICARAPSARILALSAHQDAAHAKRVMSAGALGYLSKRSAPDQLVGAIRQVAQGQRVLDPQIAQEMALMQFAGAQNPVDVLTDREFEVFMQLATGRPVNDIAKLLNLSPSTVGTHLYHIKQKLGASNSAELAMIAVRSGLVEP